MAEEKIDWYRKMYVFDEAENTKRFYTDLTDDDIKYLEAATRHDWETCNNLLDKYFHLKMPNTVVMHQVYRRDGKNDIWEYKIHRKQKSDAGWLGEGVYFYGVEEEAAKAVDYGWWLQGFYINVEHPYIMDEEIHDAIVHANDAKVSARMTDYLRDHQMDGVLWTGDGREEWCVLGANQLKRASVTRDNEGRVIPISLRFDLSKNDNRY